MLKIVSSVNPSLSVADNFPLMGLFASPEPDLFPVITAGSSTGDMLTPIFCCVVFFSFFVKDYIYPRVPKPTKELVKIVFVAFTVVETYCAVPSPVTVDASSKGSIKLVI